MHPARIAELLEPFVGRSTDAAISPAPCHSEERSDEESAVLSPYQLQHISTYIDILLRWNARINLTAIRDPEEIVTRHFGESLFAARHLFPDPPVEAIDARMETADSPVYSRRSLVNNITRDPEGSANHQGPMTNDGISAADLGSGAGFPGIPIKLWAPHLALTLIESNQKKTAFLREVIRSLTLTNVNVFPGRAQQLLQQHLQSASAGRFDLVTLRAVERFASILPVAASLVSPGGCLALLIGSSQLDQTQSTLPTLAWDPPLPIPQSESRMLLVAHHS